MSVNPSTQDEDAQPHTTTDAGEELQYRLRSSGRCYDGAVRDLHVLMMRAARHQAARTPGAYARLGSKRVDDAVTAAADAATMAVLSRLDSFEGRSLFTTWAYKFGILHTAVELRRASWRHVEIDLAALGETAASSISPEQHAECIDLAGAVGVAIDTRLTAHQRAVVVALLVENIPIDVLSERLNTTRNALYKTLHDARKRLRAELIRLGHLPEPATDREVFP